MRVAFCISGQLRDEETYLPLISEIAKDLGATVFLSVWKERGAKISGALFVHQMPRMFGPRFTIGIPDRLYQGRGLAEAVTGYVGEAQRRLKGALPPVSPADIQKHFPDAVINVEDASGFDFTFASQSNDNNSLKMLYKIWRCNELRRGWEARTGTRFDAVVRLRPDYVPSGVAALLARTSLQPKDIWVEQVSEDYATDQIAVSGADAADAAARLFGKAALSPERPWTNIHPELFRHMTECGLTIQATPLGRGLQAEPQDRQRENRRTLIDVIEAGEVAPGVFSAEQWQALAVILRALDRLENKDAVDASRLAAEVDAGTLPPALQEAYFATLALLHAEAKEAEAASAAILLAYTCHATWKPFPEAPRDDKLHMLINAVAPALSAADPFTALTLDAVRRSLHDRLLPPWLSAPAGTMLSGPQGAAAEAAAAHLERQLASRYPAMASAHFRHLLGRGDNASAVALARRMVATAPDNWLGHDHLGHALQRSGDLPGASAAAQRALELSPGHGGLHARVADLMMRQGSMELALVHFRKATETWNDHTPWGLYAEALRQAGKRQEAIQAFAEALRRRPAEGRYRAALESLAHPEG